MSRTFTVSTIGMPQKELQLLRAIFALSKGRRGKYEMITPGTERDADILVVNQDDPGAMAEWHSVFGSAAGSAKKPIVRVTNHSPKDSERFYIRKPFIATRVLGLLDQVCMSELGFEQELAFADVPRAAPAPAPASQEVQPEQKKIRVLVVDDSLPVRIQMDLALKQFASHVDFAETGDRALELVTTQRYDIIFLDVILPGADGYEICKRIKTDKEKKSTPVIMLTGNSSPADQVKGKLAGCDTYLIKPVRGDIFREVMAEYIH